MDEKAERVLKVRKNPRMTVAALAIFVTTPRDASRERIVAREMVVLKQPVITYRVARGAMRNALAVAKDPGNYLRIASERLKDAASMIEGGTPKKDREKKSNTVNGEALEHFAAVLRSFKPKGLLFAAPRKDGYPNTIETVEVSCFPVALVGRRNPDGTHSSGAVFAILKKDKKAKLSKQTGEVAAQIVRRALVKQGYKSVERELCIVVDVFNETIFTAPKRHKQIDEDTDAACRVIAAIWPKIQAKVTETEANTPVVREIPLRSPEVPQIPRSAG